MRRLLALAGLTLGLSAAALAQEAPELPDLTAPEVALPPGLAAEAERDATGDAVEGRS
jgi:hypothetical protein